MSRTRQIISDAGDYTSAALLTQFVTVIAAVLTRRFLGPSQMGVWVLVQIILTYANYTHLGTLDAIAREIPFYIGKKDEWRAEKIKNTVFSFSIMTALIVSLGVMAYAFLWRTHLQIAVFYGLLITAALVILQRLNTLLICLVRAFKYFELAGKLTFFSAVVNMILISFLSYRYKLYGFMAAMTLSFIFNIAYVHLKKNFHFRYSLSGVELKPLIAYGFPLMLLAFFSTIFETIDRLMVARFLGLEALGLYSIALMAYGYLQSVPNSISIVMIPNLHEKFGQTENKHDLKSYLLKSDSVFSVVMPVLIGAGWFLAPLLIGIVLPKFKEGIDALRLLILSAYFIGVGMAYTLFIYAIKKHWALFPLNIIAALFAVLFNWIAIQKGWGIAGVAGATTIATLFYFTMVYIYAAREVYSLQEGLKEYAVIVFKFICMSLLLFSLKNWVNFSSSLITAIAQTILYGACCWPFLWRINKKFEIFSIWFNKFKKLFLTRIKSE